jgi:alanyl-tRNA synthetase
MASLSARLKLAMVVFQVGDCMTQVPKLDDIYHELRSMNERLDFIEDLVEEVIVRQLPRVKTSKKELDEIKKSVAEMRAGETVSMEDLARA